MDKIKADYRHYLDETKADYRRYLTTVEVAELARTTGETVRYWRHVGKGPKSFKLGRKVLYAEEDVEAWLADARNGAA